MTDSEPYFFECSICYSFQIPESDAREDRSELSSDQRTGLEVYEYDR